MSETINGWTPPIIDEEYIGKSRIATQDDIRRMERQIHVLSRLARAVKDALDEFENAKAAFAREFGE